MAKCAYYIPEIKAAFGRTITDTEINDEFEAIERTFACIQSKIDDVTFVNNTIINIGHVTGTVEITPNDGVIQLVTVEGDVSFYMKGYQEGDPNMITLIIADGGSGRFGFAAGAAWACDQNGVMDGLPWNSYSTAGPYGALVTCVYDGTGWVYMVYARHNITVEDPTDTDDLYNWR